MRLIEWICQGYGGGFAQPGGGARGPPPGADPQCVYLIEVPV